MSPYHRAFGQADLLQLADGTWLVMTGYDAFGNFKAIDFEGRTYYVHPEAIVARVRNVPRKVSISIRGLTDYLRATDYP